MSVAKIHNNFNTNYLVVSNNLLTHTHTHTHTVLSINNCDTHGCAADAVRASAAQLVCVRVCATLCETYDK